MNDIKVSLQWNTGFETMEEVNEFITLISEAHKQRYGVDIVKKKLLANSEYIGAVNEIYVDVKDNRKIDGIFTPGDHVRILGVPETNPNHEAKVDFVRDGKIFVSNMNMPFAGSLNNEAFDPSVLVHYK